MRRVAIGITILTTIYLYMNDASQTSIKTTPVHLLGAGFHSPLNRPLYIMPSVKCKTKSKSHCAMPKSRVEIEKARTVVKSSRMQACDADVHAPEYDAPNLHSSFQCSHHIVPEIPIDDTSNTERRHDSAHACKTARQPIGFDFGEALLQGGVTVAVVDIQA